ncbi:MAG: ComEC/Rec2 family competence protein [Actinomycetales bacterium]|nr:ComEC/Rec2 family competence protein [Actinomycetales bacterium]
MGPTRAANRSPVAPLAIAAAGVWLGLLLTLGSDLLPVRLGGVSLVAGLTGCAAAVALASGHRALRRGLALVPHQVLARVLARVPARKASRGSAGLILAACAVASGLILGALQVQARQPDWWVDLLERRAWVEAIVTVRSPPIPGTAPTRGALWQRMQPSWRARARLDTVCVALPGEPRHCRSGQGLPVLLTAGGDATAVDVDRTATGIGRDWVPGGRIAVAGIVAAPGWHADSAGLLRVQRWQPVQRPPPWQQAAARVRQSLRLATVGLPVSSQSLIPGLAVGDRAVSAPELSEAMRVAGLSHLTAVSGGNFAIVIAAVLLLGRLIGARGRALPVLGLVALLAYATVTGPEPSVLRAGVMGAIGLLGVLCGRRAVAATALPAATVVLLCIDPWLARSWGFTLSVTATAGLIWWAPPLRAGIERRLPRLPRAVVGAVIVAIVAHLVTLPVIAGFTGEVSAVGILANILVAPVVAWVTLAGLLAAVLGVVAARPATWAAMLASPGAEWIGAVAHWSAGLPWASMWWPRGVAGLLSGLLVSCLTGWALAGCPGARRWIAAGRVTGAAPTAVPTVALILVLIAGLIAGLLSTRARPWGGGLPEEWAVAVCDVGQGDAAAVSIGPRTAIVIDAGPDPRLVDRCLRRLGVRDIPLLVLTHGHADHVDGLAGVLRRRSVGTALLSPLAEPAPAAARVARLLDEAGVRARPAVMGERWQVGGVSVEVLWPPPLSDGRTQQVLGRGSDPNNMSVVTLIDIGPPRLDGSTVAPGPVGSPGQQRLRILLTGDLEGAAQAAIMAQWAPLAVDLIKVPHHGSPDQHPGFAEWAGARGAVISVGANDYGHPAPTTVRAYTRTAAPLRTDEHGTLIIDRAGRLLSPRRPTGRRG